MGQKHVFIYLICNLQVWCPTFQYATDVYATSCTRKTGAFCYYCCSSFEYKDDHVITGWYGFCEHVNG